MKAALLALMLMIHPVAADPLPEGFVRLSDLAPGIAQDIRYARAFNFTGAPVPGYDAAECILTTRTATALIAVEARLAADGYGLIVFDCYRPQRAVAHFVDWAKGPQTDAAGSGFFPGLSRADLFPMGFIAEKSSHSLGVTVDAGLLRVGDPVLRPVAMIGNCAATFHRRVRESTLDMGTSFDCFSPLSEIGAAVGAAATANRDRLTAAMQAEGFRGYDAEWWHFRNTADTAGTPQDFPVQ